mmetsp:Transcript_115297/g.290171  ORF Transcript_115297/g.290171 Transcript_115297/m.290171 type:complete len:239 (+) Transcript_115297:1-717(+)
MLVYAMVMCQLINPYLTDKKLSEDTISWLYHNYGTASRSLWTVFEVTFSGSWPQHVRPLVDDVNILFAFLSAIYICLVVFAMQRIVTALFLKDTLAVCASDAELMIQEKMTEKRRYAAKLLDFFVEADISGDGNLSLVEFETFLENPLVRTFLATLELDPTESRSLFHMLDDGDGLISPEEFVKGAVRLKGAARSQDVVTMMHDFNKLNKKFDKLFAALTKIGEFEVPPVRLSKGASV